MYRHLEDDWYECDTCKARRRSPVDLAQVRCRCGARPEPEPDKKQPCGEPCGNRVVKLFETAWSFTKSITYWTARGFKTPTQEQYDERRAICHACPKLVKSLGMVERCGECKCVIALKAGLIQNPGQSDCPLGHWPAIGTPPEPAPDLEHTARIVRPLQTEKPVEDKSRKVLFRITKGLGDSMCFRSVLMHIKALRPDWTVDVQTHPYHASLFDRVRFDEPERGEYDTIHSAEFMRPKYCVFDAPSNTTQRFLLEVCRIKPQADLSGYGTLAPSDEELLAARRFLQRVSGEPLANGRYRVALIHPIGRSFQAHKNPPQSIWTPTIERVKRLGFVPVAINFDGNSEAARRGEVQSLDTSRFNLPQHGTSLAAIINQSSLFMGVDSGPLHVAGGCSTPAIGVWTKHHPVHCYNISRVTHLVPQNHADYLPRTNRDAGLDFFREQYQSLEYNDLPTALAQLAESKLA